jgi:hypothetical protein
VVKAISAVLGIPRGTHMGMPFRCVLPNHKEKHPSASLWTNSQGVIVYRDWHRRNTVDVYTLPTVYFVRTIGKIPKPRDYRRSIKKGGGTVRTINLRGPKHAVWSLRLLVEVGLLQPLHIDLPDLPEPSLESTRKVYEGFRRLLACKWTYGPGEPTPFARDFAAEWCGVSPVTAGEAIKRLVALGIIRPTGSDKGMTLYLPGPTRENTG